MDEIKDDNAESLTGVYICDRKRSKWFNQPRSGRLPYRNGGEKASDFHRDGMEERYFLQQPQKLVKHDELEGGIKPGPIPSICDSDTNRTSDSRGQGLEAAFNHRNRRRKTPFIKQKPFDGDEGGQKYPYIPSPSSQIRNHWKESSRQHSSGQLGNYTPHLSAVPIQSCTTTLPFITPQNTCKEKFDSPERYRYSYQQKRPSRSIRRSGDDLSAVESTTRYDRVWNPKQRYGNWLAPSWSTRYSSDHSANELCSTKTWPTYQINQHSRPRTNQAARPLNVARRLEHSPGEKEYDLVVPPANNIRNARSPGRVQVSTIASQSQTGCCLPPIEIAMDYSYRTRPEEMLYTRSKKSSNKRQPSPVMEEIVKAAEFANFVQPRPRQSQLHRASGSQEGGNGGGKKVSSNQSTLILEDAVGPLTEHHNEQFSDDNHGSRLSIRGNAERNDLEENTSRVKINGFRLSSHDIRVDLGELSKRSRICESLLENSKPQIGGKINIMLFLMSLVMSSYALSRASCHVLSYHAMPCYVISRHVTPCHVTSYQVMSSRVVSVAIHFY